MPRNGQGWFWGSMGRQLYGSPMALGPRRVVGGTGAKCAPVRVAPFGLLRKCVPVASVLVPVYMGSNIPFSEVLEVGSRY